MPDFITVITLFGRRNTATGFLKARGARIHEIIGQACAGLGVQMAFADLRRRDWGRRFWARGYFSTTSGNVTHDIMLPYLALHSKRDTTGLSRSSFTFALPLSAVDT